MSNYLKMTLLCGLLGIVAMSHVAMPTAQADNRPPNSLPLDRYEGFTHPSRELMLESYIDGMLETLHVNTGDRFNEGDVLVSMDASIQKVAVEIAKIQSESKADIAAAQARVLEAEVELESQRDLAQKGSATPRDIRRAEATLAITQAELELAKERKVLAAKQYEMETERLDLYTFKASFGGEVLEVATGEGAEEGAALRQNDPIMHLVQLDPLIAKISLPEPVVDRLKVGSQYAIGVGQRAQPAQAKLKRIASAADRGSQLIEVEFEISNPDSKIRSGVRCRLLDTEPSLGELAKH